MQEGEELAALCNLDCVGADKLRFDGRLAVLQKHGNDLRQVGVQFIQGFALRVRTRPAGNKPDEEPRFGIFFDDGSKLPHGEKVTRFWISAQRQRERLGRSSEFRPHVAMYPAVRVNEKKRPIYRIHYDRCGVPSYHHLLDWSA